MAEKKKLKPELDIKTNVPISVQLQFDQPREIDGEFGKFWNWGVKWWNEEKKLWVEAMWKISSKRIIPLMENWNPQKGDKFQITKLETKNEITNKKYNYFEILNWKTREKKNTLELADETQEEEPPPFDEEPPPPPGEEQPPQSTKKDKLYILLVQDKHKDAFGFCLDVVLNKCRKYCPNLTDEQIIGMEGFAGMVCTMHKNLLISLDDV